MFIIVKSDLKWIEDIIMLKMKDNTTYGTIRVMNVKKL